jgi:hypothetical protein
VCSTEFLTERTGGGKSDSKNEAICVRRRANYEDNIKPDLREVECDDDWIPVAQHSADEEGRGGSWYKLPGAGGPGRGPTMLHMFRFFLVVSLFVYCPN